MVRKRLIDRFFSKYGVQNDFICTPSKPSLSRDLRDTFSCVAKKKYPKRKLPRCRLFPALLQKVGQLRNSDFQSSNSPCRQPSAGSSLRRGKGISPHLRFAHPLPQAGEGITPSPFLKGRGLGWGVKYLRASAAKQHFRVTITPC